MLPDKIKILIDMTIGDGSVSKRKEAKNSYQFEIVHGEKQFEYLEKKCSILKEYGYPAKIMTYDYKDRTSTSRNYSRIRFCTKEAHTVHKYIYNKGRKGIDKSLLSVLDRRSLAYWFYDDGNTSSRNIRKKGKYVYVFEKPWVWTYSICVAGVPYEEAELIRDWLKEKFSIHSTVQDKLHPKIAIQNTRSKDILKMLIEDYVTESVRYKISYPHTRIGIPYERYTLDQYRDRLSEITSHAEDATVD